MKKISIIEDLPLDSKKRKFYERMVERYFGPHLIVERNVELTSLEELETPTSLDTTSSEQQ